MFDAEYSVRGVVKQILRRLQPQYLLTEPPSQDRAASQAGSASVFCEPMLKVAFNIKIDPT